jgi:riboflavin kinase/FMN adenylyltransferase
MHLIDDLFHTQLTTDTVLTVGAFDGLHRGHQLLIQQVLARARETGRLAGLVTFHPHPAHVLSEKASQPLPLLTSPGEKLALLEQMGLDLMVLLRFDQELAAAPARTFVGWLTRHLRMRELWAGEDFALGQHREGDVSALKDLGQELGFTVKVIGPITGNPGTGSDDGEPISSSLIRSLLANGDVRNAGHLLGRYPSLWGEVVHGAKRGQNLGFPTANLQVRPERAVPANGVYAVFAWLGPERLGGVANIGVRPSFDNGARTIEAHLFDFDRDIYGCELVVEFVQRLRPELRFDSLDALIAQMQADCDAAQRLLREEADTAIASWGTITGCQGLRYAL